LFILQNLSPRWGGGGGLFPSKARISRTAR
jgi:hypothetical protein